MADTEQVEPVCDENLTSDAAMDADSQPFKAFDLILPSDDKLKESSMEENVAPDGSVGKKKQEPDEEPANLHDNDHQREEMEAAESPDHHEVEVAAHAETEAGDEKPEVQADAADEDDDIDKHSHRSSSEDDVEVMPCDDEETHTADPENDSVSSVKCRTSSSCGRAVSRRWMLSNSGANGTPKRRSERLQCKKTPPKVTESTRSISARSAASKLSQSASKLFHFGWRTR
jgi:hypothetical protein